MNELIFAPDGYSRLKNPPKLTLRPLSIEEAKSLTYGSHVYFIANDHKARQIKINGRPQTWKTRPNDVRIPVKYGLYETGYFTATNGQWHDQQPLTLVED